MVKWHVEITNKDGGRGDKIKLEANSKDMVTHSKVID